MFGGIGGFRLGLEKAGDFKCVGYAEIDRYAVQCYNQNFGENYKPIDVATIDWSKQPDFDLLCAGFPCQSFSVAGKRKGFLDTRGTLFFEIARCAREKQPHFLLLENVKGLLSNNKGQTFATILATLDELGYDAEWQVLNSKDFGVPQNRERVFIFAWKRSKNLQTKFGGVFPIFPRKEKQITLIDILKKQVDKKYYLPKKSVKRIVERLDCYKIKKISIIADRYRTLAGKGNHPEIKKDDITYSITSVPKDNLVLYPIERGQTYPYIRRLTPIEIERLQGFSDGWTAMLSDTRRYKTVGNAVTVNVVEDIGRMISQKIRQLSIN